MIAAILLTLSTPERLLEVPNMPEKTRSHHCAKRVPHSLPPSVGLAPGGEIDGGGRN